MPKINIYCSGWIYGVKVFTATDSEGNERDIRNMSASQLAEMINNGELDIDLVAAIRDSENQEIDIFDAEEWGG